MYNLHPTYSTEAKCPDLERCEESAVSLRPRSQAVWDCYCTAWLCGPVSEEAM